jgi:hypothetical protein
MREWKWHKKLKISESDGGGMKEWKLNGESVKVIKVIKRKNRVKGDQEKTE